MKQLILLCASAFFLFTACDKPNDPSQEKAMGNASLKSTATEATEASPKKDNNEIPTAKTVHFKEPTALVGKALPNFSLEGPHGEKKALEGVEGKTTVVLLWSTWCQACLHETKQVSEWASSREDVAFLSVNVNGLTGDEPDMKTVDEAGHKLGIQGPIWVAQNQYLPALGIRTCPTSFVVKDGTVVAAREGYKGADEMNEWLNQFL